MAAILVGSAAGTADVSTGVFRDLVATGRSRWSLFFARVPGALLSICRSSRSATSSSRRAASAFAGNLVTPDAGLSSVATGGSLLVTCFDLILALGLASLIGSRGTTIGVLFGWQFLGSP